MGHSILIMRNMETRTVTNRTNKKANILNDGLLFHFLFLYFVNNHEIYDTRTQMNNIENMED